MQPSLTHGSSVAFEFGLTFGIVADTVSAFVSGFNYIPAFLDLLLQVGADRIMFSADYPYNSMVQARTFLDQLL